jgi:hypothetical protein
VKKTHVRIEHDFLEDYYRTKGDPIKIGPADRTPRETLEKRLEKTPSNARCFAHGSSLLCWPILKSLMRHACQAGAWGRYIGFCLGYGHIWGNIMYWIWEISCEAHNFVPRWNLHKVFVAGKAWDAGDADGGIARVCRATHARGIGTYSRAQFISDHLQYQCTKFSTKFSTYSRLNTNDHKCLLVSER